MKKLITTVTYKVPSWGFCNHQSNTDITQPSTTNCRFLVTTNKGKGVTVHTCALHNDILTVTEGVLVGKTNKCRNTKGVEIEEPKPVEPASLQPTPKEIMKATMKLFSKHYKQLIAQGFPADMAQELAEKAVLK